MWPKRDFVLYSLNDVVEVNESQHFDFCLKLRDNYKKKLFVLSHNLHK